VTPQISPELTLKNLKRNNFLPYFVKTTQEAYDLFFGTLLPEISPQVVSYADSVTLGTTGIIERLKTEPGIRFIDTFEKGLSWEEKIERRRQALLVDLFLTGTNAITEDGKLINLDMIGNRINGIVFGPRNVVLTAGVNKLVKDLEAGMKRIREVSVPMNTRRHTNFRLPCQKTGVCSDCRSEQRICNAWSIVEKSFPKHRIRVIIIDQELGY
jgi:hypothetical protein